MSKVLDKELWNKLASEYDDFNLFENAGIDFKNDNLDEKKIDDELFKIKGAELKIAEKIQDKKYSYWNAVFKNVFSSYLFIFCLVILVSVILLAIIIPWGKDAASDALINKPNHNLNPEAPSAKYWFGLGVYGDDFWVQMWYGTRETLLFTLIIAAIQIFLGIIIGCIWGYYRKIDIYFIEFTRLLNIIPTLILWFVVIFVFNSYSLGVIVFAVSITSWISLADVIRTQIMLIKNSEYNIASLTLGTKGSKIVRKNILPKILPVVTQTASYAVPTAISIDAALAYYGFGFISANSIKTASLGSIIQQVFQDQLWKQFPHLIIIPAIFITGISTLFFIMGKIFADSLDPKNHN